jgi:hypothetical protein
MSLPSWANMVLWINMASEVTVGAVASSLAMCERWVLPLAHTRALILPDLFLVRNMRDVRALQ